jgi:hypothetical protein
MIDHEKMRQFFELLGVTEQEIRLAREEHYKEFGVFPDTVSIPLPVTYMGMGLVLGSRVPNIRTSSRMGQDLKDHV